MKTLLALAVGLLACASLAAAWSAPDGMEPDGSIPRQLVLVAYPGIPLSATLTSQPAGSGPVYSAPERRTAAPVVIPGISQRNLFADRLHWVLGVATVLAGGVTGMLGGEGEDDGGGDDGDGGGGSLHHTMGYVSAGLAAATLATGFWAHHGDVGPSDGFSPANIHALLGIAGGLMMVATPFAADFGGVDAHAALGIGGELLMGIAVVWPLVF